MSLLIVGLALFLSLHSTAIFAPERRSNIIRQIGERWWKVLYSVASLISLALIIYGYAEARQSPIWLWQPPVAMRHTALLLTLIAFILLAATYVPGNRLKSRVGHPMLLAVKFWALAHLLANGTLADLLLFGSFLVWGVAGFVIRRKRDRINGVTYPAGGMSKDITVIIAGLASWAVFAMYLHVVLIGISPMP
ncbi:NnrU family protein [Pseudohongiella spirulinae]|uniref:NnrU n=1 Tax=Pseudohongiella spirulinae TaxID=1249552 RepID=A0A0S2KEV0_9GAMM|nr:NnrU family protein [Pseudohongiella spirulinae]ALO46761.1 NnrU [Pseudohongiella spirulinae]